jgi:hypothetical protein
MGCTDPSGLKIATSKSLSEGTIHCVEVVSRFQSLAHASGCDFLEAFAVDNVGQRNFKTCARHYLRDAFWLPLGIDRG